MIDSQILDILLLALVQGLTEFLPVSSSGHLNVAADFLGWQPGGAQQLQVNIFLHLGTLGSVLVFYWRRVVSLFGQDRRVIGLLIVGTLPAVAVGLPLRSLAAEALTSAQLAGLMFPVTGALLLLTARWGGEQTYRQLSMERALVVGIFQAFALLPGISRSGATIAGGQFAGLTRSSAVTFAFLLAIPAIAGPGILETIDLIQQQAPTRASHAEAGSFGAVTDDPHTQTADPAGAVRGSPDPVPPYLLVLGSLTALIVGYMALGLLVRVVEFGRLHLFAYYLIPLGLVVTWWQCAQ